MADERESFPEGLVNTPDAPGGYPLPPSIHESAVVSAHLSGGTATEEQKRRALADELRDDEKAEADTTGAQDAVSKPAVKQPASRKGTGQN